MFKNTSGKGQSTYSARTSNQQFGGGDQFMQAVGNGIVSPGVVSSNIGTGGQIAVMVDKPAYDSQLRTNTFCHIQPNTWNIQGSILNSGLSMGWLKSNIL